MLKSKKIDFRRKRVLDIGVGDGDFALPISEKADFVVGIDIDSERIKNLKGKIGKNLFLVVADARYLPFKDLTFDISLSIEVITHIPEKREKALKEALKVTKECFILSLHNYYRLSLGRMLYLKKVKREYSGPYFSGYITGYTKGEILELLDRYRSWKISDFSGYFPLPQRLIKYNNKMLKYIEDLIAKLIPYICVHWFLILRRKHNESRSVDKFLRK